MLSSISPPYRDQGSNMSWRTFSNCFGGQSVSIEPGCDVREVPEEFAMLLTQDCRQAHRNPTGYFEELADTCELPGL